MEAHVDRKQAGRLRAERSAEAGAGMARLQGFGAQFRSAVVKRDGKDLVQLDGYASVYDKPYDMWDVFGPYREVIERGAFDRTVAARPDVAYLVNHKGVTMARTTNGTLELEADSTGLRTRAFVNPARQDVRDLLTAIEDKNITEMSFGFMVDDVKWNDDFTECTMRQLNIDRGDVSPVNYGASPWTSVSARSSEILRDLAQLPAGAQRAAYERLDKALRAADPDDDPAKLMQAVDAAIDEAMALVAGVDLSSLPVEVAQALGLLSAADAACDELMGVTGTVDPDDAAGERARSVSALLRSAQERAAIAVHHTPTVNTTWDGPAAEAAAPNDAAVLTHMHAWRDGQGDPAAKASYKLPHHAAGSDTPANLNGVRNALARLSSTDIPEADRAGVQAHLEAHLKDGGGGEKSQAAPTGRSLDMVRALLDI